MTGRFWEIHVPGLHCALSDLGASIVSVQARDARGRFTDVALAPTNFSSGDPDPSLAGRTIGPCCGRVRDGRIQLDGAALQLARNEGENHLHGGPNGCAYQIWEGRRLSPAHVRFTLTLADGLDGYPGNRALTADYRVSGGTLSVVYSAETDAPTWLGLTNHVYWDLSGRFDGSALDQRLEVAARRVVFNGDGHLPERIAPVEGTFDFSQPASIRENMRLEPAHPQLLLGRGYNNAYIIDHQLRRSRGCAARLYAPGSGLQMTLETDQPAVVLYSGGFLSGETALEAGGATPGCAIALEAQPVPDPFHLPGARPECLYPNAAYRKEIRWRFETVR